MFGDKQNREEEVASVGEVMHKTELAMVHGLLKIGVHPGIVNVASASLLLTLFQKFYDTAYKESRMSDEYVFAQKLMKSLLTGDRETEKMIQEGSLKDASGMGGRFTKRSIEIMAMLLAAAEKVDVNADDLE